MQFTTVIAPLLISASTSFAATAGVKNNSDKTIFVTVTNSSQTSTEYTIAANGSYSQPLIGMGNVLGVTLDPNYFSSSTKKFIFGYTDSPSAKLSYWTVSNVDGDPFDGSTPDVTKFLVSASDVSCSTASTYDGQVHTCTDTVSVVCCAVREPTS